MGFLKVPNESSSRKVVHHVKTVCQGNIFDKKQSCVTEDTMCANVNQSTPSFCCLYSNDTCKLQSIIRTFIPFVIWATYLSAGSLLFTFLEDQGNAERRQKILQLQNSFPAQMSDLVSYLKSNCSGDATGHVQLVESLTFDVMDYLDKAALTQETRPWGFYASLKFCLTAISTIGKTIRFI